MTVKPYKYYLIDLDRTLWDFDTNSENVICTLVKSERRLLDAVSAKTDCPEAALHGFFLRYDKFNNLLWAEYERGELAKDDLRWLRFHKAFLSYGVEDETLARKFGDVYLEMMAHQKSLMPGARQMLDNILAAGGKMAILSNGFREIQHRKLLGSGLDGYFSAVVVSEEAGCLKPRPGIFAYAVRLLSGTDENTNPAAWRQAKRDTLMIGDDPVNDIEGAQIFGIDQFYYNHKGRKAISHATYESPDLSPFL